MHTISKVSMIILMQQDVAKAVTFYQNLGLKLLFHLRDTWAEFELGGVKIGLCPTTNSGADRRVGAVLEVPNIQLFYEHHKASGIFIGEPTEALHGIMVSCKDPGGNIIDLYQPTPERVKSFIKRIADQGCCKGVKDNNCCSTSVSVS